MNRELFQKIHDVISVSPESFDMASWEGEAACGTTRCIAGWAIHLKSGGPLCNPKWGEGDNRQLFSDQALALAEREGFEPGLICITDLAAHLLGLTSEVAERVFHTFDNELMAEYVEAAAQGDTDRCNEILGV